MHSAYPGMVGCSPPFDLIAQCHTNTAGARGGPAQTGQPDPLDRGRSAGMLTDHWTKRAGSVPGLGRPDQPDGVRRLLPASAADRGPDGVNAVVDGADGLTAGFNGSHFERNVVLWTVRRRRRGSYARRAVSRTAIPLVGGLKPSAFLDVACPLGEFATERLRLLRVARRSLTISCL